METVARMPSEFKLRPSKRGATAAEPPVAKYALKRLAARELDDATLSRPKRGFGLPLDEWFRGPARDQLQSRLLGPGSSLHEYLEPEGIRRLTTRHDRKGKDGHRLWSLVFLEAWLRQNRGRLA